MYTTAMGIMSTLSLICSIWVIYDAWAVNKSLSTGAKILWTIGALVFGLIGAAAYYFIEKNRKTVEREDSYI